MADATDIDKTEYDSLRAESLFHQTNASAIFGLNIVGLGVGITASSQIDAALLVLGVLSCVLWLRYCDSIMSLFRVAAYLEWELRPRLIARLGEPVLGWESFLRSAGTGNRSMPRLPTVDSRIGIAVASMAFLLPSPLLCAVFVVHRWADSAGVGRTVVIAGVALVLLVWLYSIRYGYRVMRWILSTDSWIVNTPDLS
ncbi:MAG TPA: hypothetical protein VF892_11310 [Pseudonocardiaceae bacterium]